MFESPFVNTIENEDVYLEQEFQKTQTLELKDGKREESLEYTIISPKENKKQGNWIIFIGGFATTKEQYKGELLNLVKLGKTVVFVNPDKGITPTEEEAQYFSKMKSYLPPTITQKAASVFALLSHLNIRQADIVGNSQGAAVATSLVGAHPGVARRLVLDCPMGMIGEDAFYNLLHRSREDARVQGEKRAVDPKLLDPTLREYDEDVWRQYGKKVARNASWRITQELPDAANVDLRPVLSELKANREAKHVGPEITLFTAKNDIVFPSDRVEEALGDDPLLFVDRWAMYRNKEKGHTKYEQPQPGDTPEEYFSPRYSNLHQFFSQDSNTK